MTWNYRVVSLTSDLGSWLEVREVYYRNGEPVNYADRGSDLAGETVEELREVHAKLGEALEKPVLSAAEIEAASR